MKKSRTNNSDLSQVTTASAMQTANEVEPSASPDQHRIIANRKDFQHFSELLNRPEKSNAGLKDLFSRQEPWVA